MSVGRLDRGFEDVWSQFYDGIDPERTLRSLAIRARPA
jgi:hypothetical protein